MIPSYILFTEAKSGFINLECEAEARIEASERVNPSEEWRHETVNACNLLQSCGLVVNRRI